MCMTLYVASDKPLPLINWNESNPNFNVTELDESSQSVRKQFSKPHVYYLGSHQCCGCGFNYGQYDYGEEEDKASRKSVRRLAEYLSQSVNNAGPLELYSCWSGDEEDELEFHEEWKTKEISGETFWFQERQFIKITN